MKFLKLVIISLFSVSLYASSCSDRVFDISGGNNSITPLEVLTSLASECSFAISVKDTKSQMILNTPSGPMSLKNVGFDELLDILINERNLNYTFTGNLLKISYYITETFKINYVGGVRFQDNQSQTSITVSNSGTESVANTSGNTGSKGSTDSTIKYNDEYLQTFWNDLKTDLNTIVFDMQVDTNSSSADKAVVINRASGLVTIKGTQEEVDRAKKYINSIEKSLHSSVMIDVSILKVTNSNSQNMGIDWNQLLNLQNVAAQYAVSGIMNRGANYPELSDDVSYPSDGGDDTGG
ncbi:MAG: hypothetical protein ACLFOC_06480, partial [Campylobacterales bacterium]